MHCRFSTSFINKWVLPVYYPKSRQNLGHNQLLCHPQCNNDWDQYYGNERRYLCQGVGKIPNGSAQRVEGTDTFHVIRYIDIPADCLKLFAYTKVVYELNTNKEDKNRAQITVGGNRIIYLGNVCTKNGSLETNKWLPTASYLVLVPTIPYLTLNFYIYTDLPCLEYSCIKLSNIPEEFFQEYKLLDYIHEGWIYFEIHKGVYGLPQSDMLANKLLKKRHN